MTAVLYLSLLHINSRGVKMQPNTPCTHTKSGYISCSAALFHLEHISVIIPKKAGWNFQSLPGNVGGCVQEIVLGSLAVQSHCENVPIELLHHGLEVLIGENLKEIGRLVDVFNPHFTLKPVNVTYQSYALHSVYVSRTRLLL